LDCPDKPGNDEVGNDEVGSVGNDGNGKFSSLRHSGEGRNPVAQVFVPVGRLECLLF